MSSNKASDGPSKLPDDMVTPIFSLKQIGALVAEASDLESGKYDLVIEFKLGSIGMKPEGDGAIIPAMGVGFGGIGIRKSSKDSSVTFEYEKKTKSRSSKK
ncbi:hypothetical protein [Stenotrophomonas maltophilia]|uniref:hypothetical protein n=1 Tax=Stenotrophomonas maltophilia TaxID=40324 RepID=UPI000AE8B86B|nr:hypothetical protein [Stenotrophomonas maltophilia]EKT4102126.1 hypothetical protein [Stenotrophomonas maltophilia]MBH1667479.1 hypothetical protein [Stenotrophomonas maltophilia]